MELDAPNIQALWANLIVEELTRIGVTTFVIAPGSRNTPLVWAQPHPGARTMSRAPTKKPADWMD